MYRPIHSIYPPFYHIYTLLMLEILIFFYCPESIFPTLHTSRCLYLETLPCPFSHVRVTSNKVFTSTNEIHHEDEGSKTLKKKSGHHNCWNITWMETFAFFGITEWFLRQVLLKTPFNVLADYWEWTITTVGGMMTFHLYNALQYKDIKSP